MKAIYNGGTNNLIAYKGNREPIQFYKGTQLIDNISAIPMPITGNPSQFKTEYNKSLINLDLKGDTEQISYEGYNLFNTNNPTQCFNSDTPSNTDFPIKIENGVLYNTGLSGHSNGGMIFFNVSNYDYITFSFDCELEDTVTFAQLSSVGSNSYTETSEGLVFGVGNYTYLSPLNTTNNIEQGHYERITYDVRNYNYFGFTIASNVRYGVKCSNLMLNEGATPIAYEPYVGGKPSPNVDYPQPINSSSNMDLMLSGAKLYDDNLYLLRNTVSKIGNEYNFIGYPAIYYTGQGTAPLYDQIKNNLKPNIKYTAASMWSSRGLVSAGALSLRKQNNSVIVNFNNFKVNTLQLGLFSLSKSEANDFYALWIYGTLLSNINNGISPTIGNAMIFVGEYTADTLPPFDEPYIEPTTVNIPIELNKLGDVADELIVDYSAKTVKLVKRVDKFKLSDQIESVTIDTSWEYGNVAIITTLNEWDDNNLNLCSHCKYWTGDTSMLSFDCSA